MFKIYLLCLIVDISFGSLHIYQSSSVEGTYPTIGYVFAGSKQGHWEINGTLVLTDPIAPCDTLHNGDQIRGNIAVSMAGACDSSYQARTVKAHGAIGLAMIQLTPSNPSSGCPDVNPTGLSDFPMVDLVIANNLTQFMEAINSSIVKGTITPDANYMNDLSVWVPFIVIFNLWSIVNMSLAGWKLYWFVRVHGPKLMLSQITLSVEIFANMSTKKRVLTSVVRIFWALEPTCIGLPIFNDYVQGTFFTFSFPYSYISTFMIAFYWQEMLHKFSKKSGLTANVYPTLQKMKIPAIVVSIILIVFEHTFAILRAFFVGGVSFTVYVTAILYLIVAITVGLFFFITGIRVLMMLRSLLKHNTKSQIIMRMSLLLCVSGFGMLLHVIGNLIVELVIKDTSPSLIAFAYGVFFGGLYLASFTQILSFATPSKKSISTSDSDKLTAATPVSQSGTSTTSTSAKPSMSTSGAEEPVELGTISTEQVEVDIEVDV